MNRRAVGPNLIYINLHIHKPGALKILKKKSSWKKKKRPQIVEQLRSDKNNSNPLWLWGEVSFGPSNMSHERMSLSVEMFPRKKNKKIARLWSGKRHQPLADCFTRVEEGPFFNLVVARPKEMDLKYTHTSTDDVNMQTHTSGLSPLMTEDLRFTS